MQRSFILSKTQLYWLCQVLGWGAFMLMGIINYTFILVGSFQWDFVMNFSIQALVGILVTHFYKVLFIKSSIFSKNHKLIWIKALFDTFNITFVISLFVLMPYFLSDSGQLFSQLSDLFLTIAGVMVNQSRHIMAWIIIYYMYKILERSRIITAEKVQLDTLLTVTELELLKTQLNPHFLFNALNSIKALVLIDADKARDAIGKLSELLQFSLNNEKVPFITIGEEMYKVEKYLELEKIRFGQRLSYQFDINMAVIGLQVPPALVLTLAENAIKHGITQQAEGGEIRIKSQIEGEHIRIEVFNTGQLKAENLSGIGLKNVRSRLKNLFGSGAEISLFNQPNKQVLASVLYPIQLKSA